MQANFIKVFNNNYIKKRYNYIFILFAQRLLSIMLDTKLLK